MREMSEDERGEGPGAAARSRSSAGCASHWRQGASLSQPCLTETSGCGQDASYACNRRRSSLAALPRLLPLKKRGTGRGEYPPPQLQHAEATTQQQPFTSRSVGSSVPARPLRWALFVDRASHHPRKRFVLEVKTEVEEEEKRDEGEAR